jgi:RNA polymerase sigma-70 factor (ECF subfamily)
MPQPTPKRGHTDKRRRQEFEKLIKQHERDIYAAAVRLTGSHQDAEDLMQEAVVNAYLGFDGFELGTNFRAWMLRIVRNTHINRYRKMQRTVNTVELDNPGNENAVYEAAWASLPSLEAEVLSRFPDEEILPALDALPEEFRAAVVLSDIHQFSYDEIARELDIPLGTVRSRIFRGRRRLRESLAEYARERHVL